MALVLVVVVRDAPVLDDAAQLQAELDGAERQTSAFLFHRVGDDVLDQNYWTRTRISGWFIRNAPRCLAPFAE